MDSLKEKEMKDDQCHVRWESRVLYLERYCRVRWLPRQSPHTQRHLCAADLHVTHKQRFTFCRLQRTKREQSNGHRRKIRLDRQGSNGRKRATQRMSYVILQPDTQIRREAVHTGGDDRIARERIELSTHDAEHRATHGIVRHEEAGVNRGRVVLDPTGHQRDQNEVAICKTKR